MNTGCSKTLILHTLVHPRKRCCKDRLCAHEDNALYTHLQRLMEVEAAVSKTLPASVFLGTDIVQFVRTNFHYGRNQGGYKALMMVVRAGARKQEVEE